MYILTLHEGTLNLLNTDLLSAYTLSDTDIQYIDNLSANASTLTADLNSDLIAKVGPGAANKQTLNALYVQRNNNAGLTENDLTNFKKFVKQELVGHNIVDVKTLKINEGAV